MGPFSFGWDKDRQGDRQTLVGLGEGREGKEQSVSQSVCDTCMVICM